MPAAAPSTVYRPRHPERSDFYKIFEQHFERYLSVYNERYEPRWGPLRPVVRPAVVRFLDCGRLQGGFARVRCERCGAEHLLAFSCSCRNFCPSCQAKRAALFAEKLVDEVLEPVAHQHLVLTQWQFYQFVALEDGLACNRLGRAAQALSDLDRLWLAAFLNALVLGVCSHSFSLLLSLRRRCPLWPLSRRHAGRFEMSAVLFQFIVGIFFFGTMFRIASAFLATTSAAGPYPWWVMHVPWLSDESLAPPEPDFSGYGSLGRMVLLIGVLAGLWAIGFALFGIRLLGGRWLPVHCSYRHATFRSIAFSMMPSEPCRQLMSLRDLPSCLHAPRV